MGRKKGYPGPHPRLPRAWVRALVFSEFGTVSGTCQIAYHLTCPVTGSTVGSAKLAQKVSTIVKSHNNRVTFRDSWPVFSELGPGALPAVTALVKWARLRAEGRWLAKLAERPWPDSVKSRRAAPGRRARGGQAWCKITFVVTFHGSWRVFSQYGGRGGEDQPWQS